MSGQGNFGSPQWSARDTRLRMAHGLDLNFPPPDQNMDLVGFFSVPDQMQAAEYGQLQPQAMNSGHIIDDEISIISPTLFSQARKNRLRDHQRIQMTNDNMGVHHSYEQMVTEFMQVHSTSYDHMNLSRDMQVYHFFENSDMIPFLPPFPKRHRNGPHLFDICADSQVDKTVKAKDVPVPPEAPPLEATLNCPICLSGLREETSTKCGHVFCKGCIKEAIIAQHKCPTCRRKLRKNDIIRIYLPRSTAA